MSGVGLTTYPSADEDLKGAESAYVAMEAELQEYLDNYEATHDYDEYIFDLDEISHDPYVLLSLSPRSRAASGRSTRCNLTLKCCSSANTS